MSYQIQQRKQENPHDIDKMPVQTDHVEIIRTPSERDRLPGRAVETRIVQWDQRPGSQLPEE
jgi:hypothetical protein